MKIQPYTAPASEFSAVDMGEAKHMEGFSLSQKVMFRNSTMIIIIFYLTQGDCNTAIASNIIS